MRRWWWLVAVLLVLAGGGYAFTRTRNAAENEPARWRTATVTRGDLLVSISASGSVRPAAEVEVRSRATGVVTDVLVDEGQRVAAGQVLVLIDDPDAGAAVRAAQANLDAAVARLAQVEAQRRAQAAQDAAAVRLAQASLDAARARLQNLLAGSRPEEVAQAEEAVRVAAAALALAQKDFERSEQLFRDGFISQQQLDLGRAQLGRGDPPRGAGAPGPAGRAGVVPPPEHFEEHVGIVAQGIRGERGERAVQTPADSAEQAPGAEEGPSADQGDQAEAVPGCHRAPDPGGAQARAAAPLSPQRRPGITGPGGSGCVFSRRSTAHRPGPASTSARAGGAG